MPDAFKGDVTLAAAEGEVIPPTYVASGSGDVVVYVRTKDANAATIFIFTGPDGAAFAAAKYDELSVLNVTTHQAEYGTTGISVPGDSTVAIHVSEVHGFITVRGQRSGAADALVDCWLAQKQPGQG